MSIGTVLKPIKSGEGIVIVVQKWIQPSGFVFAVLMWIMLAIIDGKVVVTVSRVVAQLGKTW